MKHESISNTTTVNATSRYNTIQEKSVHVKVSMTFVGDTHFVSSTNSDLMS